MPASQEEKGVRRDEMGRYVVAKCKLCRREGEKLFLKGERCYSAKCVLDRRAYAPGQHGRAPIKISEYGLRLRENQKVKRLYGLTERQCRRYFDLAAKRKGVTGEKFLELLERRLDNVLYRAGFACSRSQGRQMVRHGQIVVSGRRVDIPSFQVNVGMTIKPKGPGLAEKIKANLEKTGERVAAGWLAAEPENLEIKILAIPKREDIESAIQENLIVEFYSR
jgi:small subunit ribosomal protein S4